MSGIFCQYSNAAHKSTANTKNMNMHSALSLLSQIRR
jgi:hypothetical protein